MSQDVFSEAVEAQRAGDADRALRLYAEILIQNPEDIPSLYNAGIIYRARGEFDVALAHWGRVIAVEPDNYGAHMAVGRLMNYLGRPEAAKVSFESALASRPGDVDALTCLGNAARRLGDREEALRLYDLAIARQPDHGALLASRGYLLGELGEHELAIDSLRRALHIDPTLVRALGAKFSQQLQRCDWSEFEASRRAIREALGQGQPADLPWSFMMHTDEPAEQRNAATIHAKAIHPPVQKALWSGERYAHDRIRVAYVSADFREHATSYLLDETLERHDPSRFEVFAYAIGPRVDDNERRRIANAVAHFVDVSSKSDLEVATMIRAAEIDILIDLGGYTTHSRPQIFASRCAPVQISYLGYASTCGTHRYDYILADRHVIPHGSEGDFAEQIIRLPNSYQASQGMTSHVEDATLVERAEAGLPADAFVFCCFNTSRKLTPAVFGIWMSLLADLDGSVLWLLDDGEAAKGNLRAEARRQGIAPERLIFAPRRPRADHLARHRLADLFLDTWPCNAHTTANDALRMGLPIVTCAGKSFASRVAASLLFAVGLPELVTTSPEAYRRLVADLFADRTRLATFRRRLLLEGPTSTLFDTAQFTRDLEAAYLYASARATAGLPPAAIDVAAGN
jgi:predicted O-linked N-acetylglucosamine transferase (SPINDLY family)